MQKIGLVILLLIWSVISEGQTKNIGKISGSIIEKSSGLPIEYANIQLFKLEEKTLVEGTISDPKGNFSIKNIPEGNYRMTISFIGYETMERSEIKISKEMPVFNAGKIILDGSSQDLGEVAVVGQKSTYTQSIDKKVFTVGNDLTSSSGSVSDLMQNIPSLQVDMEGNVSLRGSENIQILVNGKPSAMMGKNRAMVLQQLPANSIERIEIITNPSAKYKPDGTAGIINLILKKERNEGVNGTLTGNVGNENRYNSSVVLNYNTGGINIFGSYGIRLDHRDRFSKDNRTKTDSLTGDKSYLFQSTESKARPVSNIGQTGIEWEINDKNSLEASVNFNHMAFVRKETTYNKNSGNNHQPTDSYDRYRYDMEYEKELEMAAKYTRKIGKNQEFSIDFTHNAQREQEDNKYTNTYLVPVKPDSKDNTLIWQANTQNILRTNYVRPMPGKDGQLELGYELETNKVDMNFKVENLVGQTWMQDKGRSNQFLLNQNIHAFYVTDKQTFGKFGVMGGLRSEQSLLNSHLVTIDSVVPNNYFSLYPTLHTSYSFDENNQLQLNYSKRINRPEGDDLNPFPEYRDRYNISAGNPKLRPEQIHSIETGYLYHKGANTISATIYYRYAYNRMTEITRFVTDSVLLTTKENLASSSATGIEGIMSRSFGSFAIVNLNINGYMSKLDASNLGYVGLKTSFSWNTTLNTNFNINKLLMLQVNLRYVSTVQTAQGERQPNFIVNSGVRSEVFKRKASLMFTVSDLFDSFRSRTIINTTDLFREMESRRSARIFYFGFVYHFGSTAKNSKEPQLKFEE